ncbi:MAG: hypothetical protein ACRC1D_01235 [Culicoidibacterales bacterium]
MGFKKDLHSNKALSPAGARSSNPEVKSSDDGPNRTMYQESLTKVNVSKSIHSGNANNKYVIFRKNMEERKVKMELFILEGEEGFEERSIRGKMTEVIKRSNDEVKSWFYDCGVEGNISSEWDSFKKSLIQFCTGQGLSSISKYRDEQWPSFLLKLKDCMLLRGYREEDILRHVRSQPLPSNLQAIFYSSNFKFDEIIRRVTEIENFARKVTNGENKRNNKPIRRYKEFHNKEIDNNKSETVRSF